MLQSPEARHNVSRKTSVNIFTLNLDLKSKLKMSVVISLIQLMVHCFVASSDVPIIGWVLIKLAIFKYHYRIGISSNLVGSSVLNFWVA